MGSWCCHGLSSHPLTLCARHQQQDGVSEFQHTTSPSILASTSTHIKHKSGSSTISSVSSAHESVHPPQRKIN